MGALTQALRNLGGALRGSRPPLGNSEERRTTPRVSKRLTVHVEGHTLTSTSVSESGLQVSCPERWLRTLKESWDRAAAAVKVELPGGETIDVQCAVAYVSEWGDEFLIGLKFNQPDERARVLWQASLTRLNGAAPGMGGTA